MNVLLIVFLLLFNMYICKELYETEDLFYRFVFMVYLILSFEYILLSAS